MERLVSLKTKCLIILAVLLANSVQAAANDIGLTDLRYEIRFRDGSDFVESQKKMPWMVDFQKTNLYRGLMLRMVGLTGALPSKEKPTWQGRLSDYLIEKVLAKRPITISYYQLGNLVSPTGFAIAELGSTEQKIVKQIVKAMSIAGDQSVTVVGGEVGYATPIAINSQKIAVSMTGGCLGLARDPNVAVAASQSCARHKMMSDDVRVSVNALSLASSTAVAIAKWSQLGRWLQMDLKKKSDGSFAIQNGSISLDGVTALADFQMPEILSEALPSSTLFAASVAVNIGENLTSDSLRTAIAEPNPNAKALPMTFFYLGSRKTEDGILSDVGLLFSTKSGVQVNVEEMNLIFGTYYGREIFARAVCQSSAIVVSPYTEVIEQVEAVCAKKIPALKNAAAEVAKSFAGTKTISSVFINPGKILSYGLNLGLKLDEMTDADKPEILEAQKIIERVPAMHFVGERTQNEIRYKAHTGVF